MWGGKRMPPYFDYLPPQPDWRLFRRAEGVDSRLPVADRLPGRLFAFERAGVLLTQHIADLERETAGRLR